MYVGVQKIFLFLCAWWK